MVFCGCCSSCCCASCKKNEKLKDVKLHYVREIVALVVMLLMVSLLFLPTIITPSTEELMKQENNLHELNTIALDNSLPSRKSKEFEKGILSNVTLLTALGRPDLAAITKNRQKVLEKLEEELRRSENRRRDHGEGGGTTPEPDSGHEDEDEDEDEDVLMRLLSNVLAIRAQDQLNSLGDQGGTGRSAEDVSREVPGPPEFPSRGRRPPLTVGRVPVSEAPAPGPVPGDIFPDGPLRAGPGPDPARAPGLPSVVPEFPEEGLSNTGKDAGIRQTPSSSAGVNVGLRGPTFGEVPAQNDGSLRRGPGHLPSGSAISRGTPGDFRRPSSAAGRSPPGNAPVSEDPVTTDLGGPTGTRLSNALDTHLADGTLPPSSDSASLLLLLSNVAAARALDRLSEHNDVTSGSPKTGVSEGQGSSSPSAPPPSSPLLSQTVPVSGATSTSGRTRGQQGGASVGESVRTTNNGLREPVIGQVAGIPPGIPSPPSGTRANVPVGTRPSSGASSTTTVSDFSRNLPVSSNTTVPVNSVGVVGVPAVPPTSITTQNSDVPGAPAAGFPSESGQILNTPVISVNSSFPSLGSTLNASTPISSFVFHVANPLSRGRGSSFTSTGPQVGQGTGNIGVSTIGEVSAGTVFPAGVLPRRSPSRFPENPSRPTVSFVNPFPFPPGPVSPEQLGIKTSSPRPKTTATRGSTAGPVTTFATGSPVSGPVNPVIGSVNPVSGPVNPITGPVNPVSGPINPANFSQFFRSVAHVGVLKAQQAAANSVLGSPSSTTSTSTPVHSHFQVSIPGHSHFHAHSSPSPPSPTSPPSSTRSPFPTHPQEKHHPITIPTASTPTQTIPAHFTIPTHSTISPANRSPFPTFPPSVTSRSGTSEAKQHLGRNAFFGTSSTPSFPPQRSDTSPSSTSSSSRTSPSPNINRSVFSFSPPSSHPPQTPPNPSPIPGFTSS